MTQNNTRLVGFNSKFSLCNGARVFTFFVVLLFVFALFPAFSLSALVADGGVEEFKFEVTVGNGETFSIPLSGFLNMGWGKQYSWDIVWGDGDVQSVSSSTAGSPQNGQNSAGIPHTYVTGGKYVITITPAGPTDAWLGAFGFYSVGNGGANVQSNKIMVTKVLSPLTPLMTRTTAQLTVGAPNYEWAYTFYSCTNLVMGDGFTFSEEWNSIKTVGNYFASGMFYGCVGASFCMVEGFNLPQSITTAGTNFASSALLNLKIA